MIHICHVHLKWHFALIVICLKRRAGPATSLDLLLFTLQPDYLLLHLLDLDVLEVNLRDLLLLSQLRLGLSVIGLLESEVHLEQDLAEDGRLMHPLHGLKHLCRVVLLCEGLQDVVEGL